MNFEIYCDECRPELFTSRKKVVPYLSIGGVWIPAQARQEIKNTIRDLQSAHNIWGELKWNKVSRNAIDFYKAIIEMFFNNDDIRFRTILVDSNKVDLFRFHENDAELGFYKFYYQLIHHWILDFNQYRIFLDRKTNRLPNRLSILHKALNYSNLSSKINSVQALQSKKVNLIQLADLLTGAVNSFFNQSVVSDVKKDLINTIKTRLNHEIRPTWKSEEKFNIFKIQLQGGW